MDIRRNKDGQQNITDLRKAVDESDSVTVSRFGGNWQISKFVVDCWRIETCPYYWDERQALQSALGIDVESKDEAKCCQ